MNRHVLVWGIFVIAWTAALLTPLNFYQESTDFITLAKGLAGKTLHFVAYMTMTILTARLGAAPRCRLLWLFFVMAHAAATELLQEIVPGRTGAASDVCIDHAGVLLGLLLSWGYWTQGIPGPALQEPGVNGAAHDEPRLLYPPAGQQSAVR